MLASIKKWWSSRANANGSSIRSRIVILALIVVTPLFFDRVRLLETHRSDQAAIAATHASELARNSAAKLEDMILVARAILQTASRAFPHVAVPSPECNQLLADVAAEVAWARSLAVISRNGRFVCASNPTSVGTEVGDRRYFQEIMNGAPIAIGGFVRPRSGSQPGLVIAVRQSELGGGAVAMLVDLQQITQIDADLEQRTGAVAMLVDDRGMVITADAATKDWLGRDASQHPAVRAALARKHGTIGGIELDGTKRTWAFAPAPTANATVIVGFDEALILARISRGLNLAYFEVALAIVLVLLGAWAFGETAILRPIRALARHAELIGRGRLGLRTTDRQWAPEFAPLTRSLDSMAARLAEREDHLRSENDRFKELASTDGLTGLSNRRAFDSDLEDCWQRARDRRQPLALLMIDVDYFKRFNDTYGHLAGDDCLRVVGALLLTLGDGSFRAGRIGGEEFAVVAPAKSEAEARALAQKFRLLVQGLSIPHTGTPTGVVTVSIGLASLVPNASGTVQSLIAAADAALYASKRSRNAVTAYGDMTLAAAS